MQTWGEKGGEGPAQVAMHTVGHSHAYSWAFSNHHSARPYPTGLSPWSYRRRQGCNFPVNLRDKVRGPLPPPPAGFLKEQWG